MRLKVAALPLIVLALGSCNDDPIPTAAPTFNLTFNVNQIVHAPTPTTPGTGVGQPGRVTSISIGKFGEQDCANPTGQPGTVRVGCRAKLTCTPKCGGRDCTPQEHGERPDFFGATKNEARVRVEPDDQNAFNLDAVGLAPGDATFGCSVLGISSGDRTLTVVP